MLTLAAILVVLLAPVAVIVAIAMAVESWQRARADVAARQIRLTDAIHAELGPIASPFVEKHAFRAWRVRFVIAEGRARDMARLISITDRVFQSAPLSSA